MWPIPPLQKTVPEICWGNIFRFLLQIFPRDITHFYKNFLPSLSPPYSKWQPWTTVLVLKAWWMFRNRKKNCRQELLTRGDNLINTVMMIRLLLLVDEYLWPTSPHLHHSPWKNIFRITVRSGRKITAQLVFPKACGFGQKESQHSWDLQLQTRIPFRFRTNDTQTPNYQLHPGSNLILYPQSCWDASSAACFGMVNQLIGQPAMVPAHTTRQESCRLAPGAVPIWANQCNTHLVPGNGRFFSAQHSCEIQEPF